MRLVNKGKYINEEQLPKGILPETAIKFNEPDDPKQLKKIASYTLLPIGVLCACIILISFSIFSTFRFSILCLGSLLGILSSFLMILPHEFLHGICFGKHAEVELYFSLKNMMAFVVSTQPISKRRFIFMNLLPNLVFGWGPFLIWAFIPLPTEVASFLFAFSISAISCGIGDYLNVYNALKQMPKGSYQQLSGFHSYWYMK